VEGSPVVEGSTNLATCNHSPLPPKARFLPIVMLRIGEDLRRMFQVRLCRAKAIHH